MPYVCVSTEGRFGVLGASPHLIAGVITLVRQRITDRDIIVFRRQCFQSNLIYANGPVLVFDFGGVGGRWDWIF